MEKDLLAGGIKKLGEIKNKLIQLNNYNEEKNKLETLENQLEKEIRKIENKKSEEIKNLASQRRSEIEDTIDEQIKSVNKKLKKIQGNKEKLKKKGIVERIDVETSDYRSEEEELSLGGKSIFKTENIPLLYNNRLFFALYFPKGLVDIGIIILTIALTFFAIPLLVYYIFFNGMNVIYLALCNIISIIIFGGIYLILGKVKYKHIEALHRVRDMRKRIQDSKRKQKKIKKQIRSDEDEKGYGLEEFDNEINSLELSISDLHEQKIKALSDFDNNTSQDIKRQINSSYEQELKDLKAEHSKIYQEGKENLDLLNDLAIEISTDYEAFIGKDFLTIEKIEQLEEIISSGQGKTIEEAIAIYSQPK